MHELIGTRCLALLVALVVLTPVRGQDGAGGGPGARGQGTVGAPTQQPSAPTSDSSIGAAGSGSYAFRFSYYENGDAQGDGNPFLNEDLQVYEPVVYFDYNVTDATQLWGQFNYDRVSSASIDRLSRFPEQSGATGDNYIGLDLGLKSQVTSDDRVGGYLGVSVEYDYRSLGVGGSWAHEFEDGNQSLEGSLTFFFDQLDVIRFNGVEESGDDRFTASAVLNYYRVHSRRTHGTYGLSLTSQSGFLETPYNAVVLENPADAPNPNLFNMARGTEFTEELPNDRLRLSLFGRVRRAFGESDSLAGEIGGRFYFDDWGITSFTLEPRALFWAVRDELRMSAHYRFYTQTEADDYQKSFSGPSLPQFRTQDADLADLVTHTLGLRLDWYTSDQSSWEFGAEYTSRDDGLDFLFATIAYAYRF